MFDAGHGHDPVAANVGQIQRLARNSVNARARAYRNAGADGLFALGASDPADIAAGRERGTLRRGQRGIQPCSRSDPSNIFALSAGVKA